MTELALHDLYDGDEPKIDLDPDIATAIHERTDEMREYPLNAYTCDDCGLRIATRLVHVGGTPMFMACDSCGGMMKSAGYPRTTPQEKALAEQRREEIEERKRRQRELVVVTADGVKPLDEEREERLPNKQPVWLETMVLTYDWYRPSAAEFLTLDPETQEHVMHGGLLKRRAQIP